MFISIVTESYHIAAGRPHYDVYALSIDMLMKPFKDVVNRMRDYSVQIKAGEEDTQDDDKMAETMAENFLEQFAKDKMSDEMMVNASPTLVPASRPSYIISTTCRASCMICWSRRMINLRCCRTVWVTLLTFVFPSRDPSAVSRHRRHSQREILR